MLFFQGALIKFMILILMFDVGMAISFWFASRTNKEDDDFFQLARLTNGPGYSLWLAPVAESVRTCTDSHLFQDALPVWWAYLGILCLQAQPLPARYLNSSANPNGVRVSLL